VCVDVSKRRSAAGDVRTAPASISKIPDHQLQVLNSLLRQRSGTPLKTSSLIAQEGGVDGSTQSDKQQKNSWMSSPTRSRELAPPAIDILVVTAVDVELTAVRARLRPLSAEAPRKISVGANTYPSWNDRPLSMRRNDDGDGVRWDWWVLVGRLHRDL
jgi:hypothetical protein